jgi:hypothetical protein
MLMWESAQVPYRRVSSLTRQLLLDSRQRAIDREDHESGEDGPQHDTIDRDACIQQPSCVVQPACGTSTGLVACGFCGVFTNRAIDKLKFVGQQAQTDPNQAQQQQRDPLNLKTPRMQRAVIGVPLVVLQQRFDKNNDG